MVSQAIWIAVIVGNFLIGLGAGYVIFLNTDQPEQMMSQTQLMQQMMMQSPEHRQQMMDALTQDPEDMHGWMANTQHIQEMSQVMGENHDFMMEMMAEIMDDPDLRLQMVAHMTENPEAMQMMMQLMGTDGTMMHSGSMMSPGLMEGMMSGPMMSNMQFNLNAPINMPMIDGYHNGEKLFFIHTEVSDKNMADMMSMMINFPTLHVSDLTNIPQSEMSKVYVFTNGIPGSGPYGGGPFMFQIDVFDSIPGQMGYSQFRVPHLVTWNDDSTPRILTSVEDILEAESNGELTIQKTDNVVNAPMMTWKSNGMEQRATMVQRMFESMPGVDGEITNIDVDNYIVMMKLHSQNSMGMMDSGMMNP